MMQNLSLRCQNKNIKVMDNKNNIEITVESCFNNIADIIKSDYNNRTSLITFEIMNIFSNRFRKTTVKLDNIYSIVYRDCIFVGYSKKYNIWLLFTIDSYDYCRGYIFNPFVNDCMQPFIYYSKRELEPIVERGVRFRVFSKKCVGWKIFDSLNERYKSENRDNLQMRREIEKRYKDEIYSLKHEISKLRGELERYTDFEERIMKNVRWELTEKDLAHRQKEYDKLVEKARKEREEHDRVYPPNSIGITKFDSRYGWVTEYVPKAEELILHV